MIEAIATELVKQLAIGLLNSTPKKPASRMAIESTQLELSAGLSRHQTFASNWSSRDELYGLPTARDVDDQTIPLTLTDAPRRFRGQATLLRLASARPAGIEAVIERFRSLRNVEASARSALDAYEVAPRYAESRHVKLKRTAPTLVVGKARAPYEIEVDLAAAQAIYALAGRTLV